MTVSYSMNNDLNGDCVLTNVIWNLVGFVNRLLRETTG